MDQEYKKKLVLPFSRSRRREKREKKAHEFKTWKKGTRNGVFVEKRKEKK